MSFLSSNQQRQSTEGKSSDQSKRNGTIAFVHTQHNRYIHSIDEEWNQSALHPTQDSQLLV